MRYSILFLIVIITFNCKKTTQGENAAAITKAYCDCLDKQLSNAPDSSVDLNDCSIEVFSKSRLCNIYADYDNHDKYNKETLDSAWRFVILVRDIADTLCYNKINYKKVKRHPHAL